MTPNKAIAKYKITYEKNGFIQYKDLISYTDYEQHIMPMQQEILELEYSLTKKNKDTVNTKLAAIKRQLKKDYGDNWFLDKSPLNFCVLLSSASSRLFLFSIAH